MIIILSSAYVSSELAIEFGRLPPAFLPVGGKRLYEMQIEQIQKVSKNQRIVLTIPLDYSLNVYDQRRLNSLNVALIRLDPKLSIGQALFAALNSFASPPECLAVLHGDTCLTPIPTKSPSCAVAPYLHGYDWEAFLVNDKYFAIAGYLSFSSGNQALQLLAKHDLNYIAMIREYVRDNYIVVSGWNDFGTSSTYHLSRKNLMVSRAFNNLSFVRRWLVKKIDDVEKCQKESNWYRYWPSELRDFLPQFLDVSGKDDRYMIEFLPLSTLADIAVFGHQPTEQWAVIFRRIFEYLTLVKSFNQEKRCAIDHDNMTRMVTYLWRDKIFERLNQFPGFLSIEAEYTINGIQAPSVTTIVEICQNEIRDWPIVPCLWHGDLCFSNILFDFSLIDIKLIDPRGVLDSKDMIQDIHYDLAKLYHSVTGLYDFINAGQFNLAWDGSSRVANLEIFYPDYWEEVINVWHELANEFEFGLAGSSRAAVVLLMFSLIPLHYEDPIKQRAFFVNAIRLFLAR